MVYLTKAIVDGIELPEQTITNEVDGVKYEEPSITGVKLVNVVTQNAIPIGDVASDSLTFTINNPWKPSYDGSIVELWVSQQEVDKPTILDLMSDIDEGVGTETTDEAIDDDDDVNEFDEDEEEGEDMTDEEISEADDVQSEIDEAQFIQFEGEDIEIVDETTDEEEEPEWVKLGTYFVCFQENKDNAVKLTCYDSMAKLTGVFEPTVRETTLQNLFDDLIAQIYSNYDVVVDEFTFDNPRTINWNINATYRDSLGYIASMIGAYVDCDENGELSIAFATTDSEVRLDADVIQFNESSAGELLFTGLSCNRAIGGEADNIIESGLNSAVEFTNPFMTQAELDAILPLFEGYRVSGATAVIPYDISMRAGSSIRLCSTAEYTQYQMLSNALDEAQTDEERAEIRSNMNMLGTVIFICSQTIKFGGEALTAIVSSAATVTELELVIRALFEKSLMAETNRAKQGEAEASKTASNYLYYDVESGLYVTDDTDTRDNAVKIDSYSVNIIKGGEQVASFGEETKIGKPESFNLDVTQNSLGFNENDESALGSITAYTKESSKGLNIRGEAVQLASTRKGSHSFVGDAIFFNGWQGNDVCQADISVIDSTNQIFSEINVKKDKIKMQSPLLDLAVDSLTVGGGPAMILDTKTLPSSTDYAFTANQYRNDLAPVIGTMDGYTPIVYAIGSNNRYIDIINWSHSSGTVNVWAMNRAGSSQSTKLTIKILWVSNRIISFI